MDSAWTPGREAAGRPVEGWAAEPPPEEPIANDSLLDADLCDQEANGTVLASAHYKAALYVSYVSVLVLALLGNGLVCYVVHASPRMWTVTNYFIVNLAVGDMLLTLLCVPFSFVSTLLLQHWPFGPELCRTVSFSQAVSVLVSAYTLVAISVDRYLAIRWPLRPRMSKRQAKAVIGVVWLVALLTALPIALTSRLSQPNELFRLCGRFMCEEHWPCPQHRYYYSMALLALQYLLPLSVLVCTYTLIAVVVWGKRTPGEAQNVRDQRMARSKRKMVKMMVTVVIVFTVCWLPFNILQIVSDNNEELLRWSGLPLVYFACHWLAMSHSCYNPVIYCWMNARFRAGFCQTLGRVPGLRRLLLAGGGGPRGLDRGRRGRSGSLCGIALTGLEASETQSTALQRVPTCTSWAGYASAKRAPAASAAAAAAAAAARGVSPPRCVSLRLAAAPAPTPAPAPELRPDKEKGAA